MKNTFKQQNIINSKTALRRYCLAANMHEAGGQQGRLCGYRKAAAPLTKLMNLVWGL